MIIRPYRLVYSGREVYITVDLCTGGLFKNC